MKINKYLKKLGLKQEDMPGYYDPKLKNDSPGADPRNKEDEEGFCSYEFFNLDHTLDLIIYSKLCYFREHIADLATPGHLLSYGYSNNLTEDQKEAPHKLWLQIVDEMIKGFKVSIVGIREGYEGIDAYKIRRARQLLIEYWDCLWY